MQRVADVVDVIPLGESDLATWWESECVAITEDEAKKSYPPAEQREPSTECTLHTLRTSSETPNESNQHKKQTIYAVPDPVGKDRVLHVYICDTPEQVATALLLGHAVRTADDKRQELAEAFGAPKGATLGGELINDAAFGWKFGAGDKVRELAARPEITPHVAASIFREYPKMDFAKLGDVVPTLSPINEVEQRDSVPAFNPSDVVSPPVRLPKWVDAMLSGMASTTQPVREDIRREALRVFVENIAEPLTEAIGTWDRDKLNKHFDELKGYMRQ